MRPIFKPFLLLSVIFTMSVACGDPDDGSITREGEDSDDASIAVEQWSSAYAAAICEQAFSCCSTEEILLAFGRYYSDYQSEAQCRVEFGSIMSLNNQLRVNAVAAGRMEYNADTAAECLRELQRRSCAETIIPLDGSIDACEHVFRAKVADGGECSASEECVEGHYCVGLEFGNTDKLGLCRPRTGAGDDCGDAAGACMEGYECIRTWSPDTDNEWVNHCEKIGEIGEECAFNCVEGAYCDADGMCRASKGGGQLCSTSEECDADTYCDPDAAVGERTCITGLIDDWEPCDNSDQCRSGSCGIHQDPNAPVCISEAPAVCTNG
ncbi:hypothetical protein DFR33_108117 [Bradymonas sediminis]|nr:hypothetical protein DFR33_108117 [Bradymonas sediminis]